MPNDMTSAYLCRVCGLKLSSAPWGEDGHSPSFEICPCCGVEFGYEDSTLIGIIKYREQWLLQGGKWVDKKHMPKNWNLDDQLKQIPPDYL